MSRLFPEIDPGDEDLDPSIPPAPPPNPWHTAGARATKALAHVVAPHELLPGATLARAEFSTAEALVRLHLEAPALPRVSLSITPRSQRPAALRTRQLNLSYAGAEYGEAVKELLNRVHYRLSNAPFELLYRAATLPDPPPEPPPAPPPPEPVPRQLPTDNPRSVAWTYLSHIGWRSFFEQQEMFRGLFHGMRGPVTTVLHADIECYLSDAPRFDGSLTFFNFPRQETWSTERGNVDARVQEGARFLVTDMDDRDVIKGADTRLEHLLADASDPDAQSTARAKRDGMVFVIPTCISLVTGDDIDAAAERNAKRRRLPVVNVGNLDDPFLAMVDRVTREPGFRDRARVPHRVNLVGLLHFPGRAELLSLLRDAGVEVGCELLPTFDIDRARDYLSARAQVLYPTDQTKTVHDLFLNALDIETLAPPSPFGLAGTRHWVEAIGAATDREAACVEALDRAWAPLAPQWNALRHKLRGATFAFVIDAQSAEVLREPSRLQGVPILPMLLEMGVEVVALQYAREGHPPPPPPLPGVPTEHFHTPAELDEKLRASRAAAVYSDIFADPRITRAGKQVFSLRDVAMGLRGAVETAQRLAARCESPFLRRYSRYLTPVTHGR